MIETETSYEILLVGTFRTRSLMIADEENLRKSLNYYQGVYPSSILRVTKTTYCKVCGGTGQVAKKRNPLARGKCPSCHGKNNYMLIDVTDDYLKGRLSDE